MQEQRSNVTGLHATCICTAVQQHNLLTNAVSIIK